MKQKQLRSEIHKVSWVNHNIWTQTKWDMMWLEVLLDLLDKPQKSKILIKEQLSCDLCLN